MYRICTIYLLPLDITVGTHGYTVGTHVLGWVHMYLSLLTYLVHMYPICSYELVHYRCMCTRKGYICTQWWVPLWCERTRGVRGLAICTMSQDDCKNVCYLHQVCAQCVCYAKATTTHTQGNTRACLIQLIIV